MSIKSVLIAWIRAFLMILMVASAAALIVVTAQDWAEVTGSFEGASVAVVVGMILLGIPAALYWATHGLTRAPLARALELADLLAIPREVVEEKFARHRPTPNHDESQIAPRRLAGAVREKW